MLTPRPGNVSSPLTVEVRVTNTGARDGACVVLVFAQDPAGVAAGRIVRPWKRLVAFARVGVAAQAQTVVAIDVFRRRPRLLRREHAAGVQHGTYAVSVGMSSGGDREEVGAASRRRRGRCLLLLSPPLSVVDRSGLCSRRGRLRRHRLRVLCSSDCCELHSLCTCLRLLFPRSGSASGRSSLDSFRLLQRQKEPRLLTCALARPPLFLRLARCTSR